MVVDNDAAPPPGDDLDRYHAFLKAKVPQAGTYGAGIAPSAVHPLLKPHQNAIVRWMVEGGRRACFAAFGLGKTMIALETVRLTLERAGGRGLIVLPLGVRQEFTRDAAKLGLAVQFIRRIEECEATGIYLTNYETVRDGKLDPRQFSVASLDEASCLRGFGGVKIFREFMALFAGDRKTFTARTHSDGVPYRFVATACPSPNEYIELLAYAAFLGILDVSAAKTRFFKRDSTKADKLTLHPHKEQEFWLWVASWALFLQKPSDLTGNPEDDAGYILPPLDARWHTVQTDHSKAGTENNGQGRLFRNAALGVVDAAREKRDSMATRVAKIMEILRDYQHSDGLPDQIVIWCDLNSEQRAIEKILRAEGISFSSLYGNQSIDLRENLLKQWFNKETGVFLSKPMMYGAGVNLQQSHITIFAGIGFKFSDFLQAIHRTHRFLQTHSCETHLIYTAAEHEVRQTLERKWQQHTIMVEHMTTLIQRYGLSHAEMATALTRSLGVKERIAVSGERYRLVHNDCIEEVRRLESQSVHLILTSPPFSTQYEYSPSYADLGHTDTNAHFFQHIDFLTPELLRVLQPGRIAAIHVKDRIVPGGLTGLGFQTVYPFHAKCIEHYTQHGFAYLGMKTIVTDVVRENNQTYRLGWTEQCKDGTKMGVGMPEYLLLFRKPPTDTTTSYADVPVVKSKQRYSRSRWQTDAHGFARSNGNRPLTAADLDGIPHDSIFKLFRQWGMEHIYAFEHHVRLGEALDVKGRLPVTFMLLQPPSWHPDVWTDITRMLTLNSSQWSKGKEMHLCAMQFDIADRVIEQFTMPGETVLDPFAGIGTVPYRAILHQRYGLGIELSLPYFLDGAAYCKAAEEDVLMPTLFDLLPSTTGEDGDRRQNNGGDRWPLSTQILAGVTVPGTPSEAAGGCQTGAPTAMQNE